MFSSVRSMSLVNDSLLKLLISLPLIFDATRWRTLNFEAV